MANEKFTQLPTVVSAALTDVIAAVQTSTSVQETLQQVFNLFLSNTILHNAGNPNLAVAGSIYQLCWDTTNSVLYVCTTTGNATTAVWTLAGSVTFPIPLNKGGTNASLTADNGGIIYSTATALSILAHTTVANQILLSGNAAAPSWSTAAYPATTTINQLLYSSAANAIAGLATTNSAVLATSSAGVPTWLGALTNGQIVIGSTGAIPTATTLTAGSGVSISNGAGSITISTVGGGVSWTDVTGATQTLAVNNGYIADRGAGNVVFTLPDTSAIGDTIYIVGKQNGWSITQGASQQIIVGSSASTVGAGGSIASTNAADSITLVCTTTNNKWTVVAQQSSGLTIV